jgi:hypothetical protein
LLSNQITVEVHNKGLMGGKKHVGIAKRVLREAVTKMNTDVVVVFNLTHKGKKETLKGTLSFKARIFDDAVETKPPSQKSAESKAETPAAAAPAPVAPEESSAPPTDKKPDASKIAPTSEDRASPIASKVAAKEPQPVVEEPTLAKKKVTAPIESAANSPPQATPPPSSAPAVDTPAAAAQAVTGGQEYTLILDRISIKDVQNTGGIMDGQDPAVTVVIGNQRHETARWVTHDRLIIVHKHMT